MPVWRTHFDHQWSFMITDFTTYHREYYRKRRQKLLDYLGGVCVECGSSENLHIDHIDPSTKSFDIFRNMSISNSAVLQELSKCQLLCRKHHEEKTARENRGWTHGTSTGWQRYKCRCELCEPKWREFNENRNAKRREATQIRKLGLTKSSM